jgi:hypothetical protein
VRGWFRRRPYRSSKPVIRFCGSGAETDFTRGKLSAATKEALMSDYRNYGGDPNDPLNRNFGYEPATQGSAWGWIIGAAFLVIVLALAFGMSHEPKRVASNDATAPSATHPATPNGANPAQPAAPGLMPPAQAPAPSFAPNRP